MGRDPLSDSAERNIRGRQKWTILFILLGIPLLGGLYGLFANLMIFLIGILPGPFSWVLWATTAMVVIALCDIVGERAKEPVSDAVNHGLTRVFAFGWVPYQERRLRHWPFEPWRTAFVSTFLVMMVANNVPDAFAWSLFADNPWVSSPVTGMVAALVRFVLIKDTWVSLLRRGNIAT